MTDWEKCIAFHGHSCGGLRIGYQAAQYARQLLQVDVSDNEQLVCISENDACGVDAIQVLLGCSIGKGNLLFHVVGKQAFSFYNRATGESVRLVLKPKPAGMTPEESARYYFDHDCQELFWVKETKLPLPAPAKIFDSYDCECCGEKTGANWIRLVNGRKLCLDCCEQYNRFDV